MEPRKKIGRLGEKLAKDFLKRYGYEILEQNFQKRFGEIDIIARKAKTVIFVEVKLRDCSKKRFPGELPQAAVNRQKIKKLKYTAEYYIYFKKLARDYNYRFDVIAIILYPSRARLKHIKYAFY
ncbi:MAG: YraN family protein [Candidatus Moranbacteria bacterium]|nr:YraN family protein [Candidatus Moranbacteria bacterium]